MAFRHLSFIADLSTADAERILSATYPSVIDDIISRALASRPSVSAITSATADVSPLAVYATRCDPAPSDCCVAPRVSCNEPLGAGIAFLMSRQAKYPDGRRPSILCLIDSVRTALNAGETVVTSDGTLAFDLASRLCDGRPHWLVVRSVADFRSALGAMGSTRALPILPVAAALAKSDAETLAARDDWIVNVADRFVCVALRKRSGWIARLAGIPRQNISAYPSACVTDSETDARGNAEFLDSGARLIQRIAEPDTGLNESSADDDSRPRPPMALPFGGSYFLHHTSGSSEPWPNETAIERLDRISGGNDASRCDGIGALWNIIKTKTLYAGGGGLLPGERAVCFTTLKLSESRAQFKYDRARGRHVFSPCAVGIRRDSLLPRIKPVLYGDRSVRELIPAADRFRFQLMDERAGASKDYRNEYEWRSATNVILDAFNDEDIFLVAETDQDALKIKVRSPWRVVSANDLMNAEAGRNA